MKPVHKYLLICTVLLFLAACKPVKNYNITVMPKGMHVGDTLYMGTYKGRTLNLHSIASIDNKGIASFTGKPALQSGMYSIGAGESNNFDFLISDNQSQKFSVNYDTVDVLKTLSFNNSKENTEFTNYIKQQKPLNRKLTNYGRFPMLSLYIKSHSDVTEHTLNKDYHKKHYFDNIDFADERVARMPLLEGKLYEYFFHVSDVLDTLDLKSGIDDILNKSADNTEVYSLAASFLYDVYINSPFPNHEKIADYIAENYILAGYTSVFDADFIARVKSETNWINQNPVGSIAPDIKLQSLSGDYVSLKGINSNTTALLFLDPDCGACLEIVPQVYDLYRKYKDRGFEVYAVYLGYDEKAWKLYIIKEQYDWINVWSNNQPEIVYNNFSLLGMPTIYLLDNEKRIIGKDVSVDELEELLLKQIMPQ